MDKDYEKLVKSLNEEFDKISGAIKSLPSFSDLDKLSAEINKKPRIQIIKEKIIEKETP